MASDMRGGSGQGFVFGDSLWLRAYGLDVRESIVNAGMRDSLGEKWKHCKVSWKGLEAQRRKSVCFSF